MGKPVKLKKCKHCGEMFKPYNTIERLCSPACIIANLSVSKRKEVQRATRKRWKAHNDESRKYQLSKTEDAVNAFVRERDKDEPCISCSRHHSGQYHAGHYRSVGAAPHLRFNQLNIHKQCSACNNYKSGNAIEYRINLVKKVGVAIVESIESNNDVVKWTLDEIKAIGVFYKTMLKGIRNER